MVRRWIQFGEGGGVQMKGIKGEGEAGKSNIEQSFLSSREGKTWVT